jgi:hypothetical protein
MYKELTKIVEVTILREEGNIQVGYDKQGLSDETEVWRKTHHELYSVEKKDQFIADMENPDNGGAPGVAAPYIAAVGW